MGTEGYFWLLFWGLWGGGGGGGALGMLGGGRQFRPELPVYWRSYMDGLLWGRAGRNCLCIRED